MGEHRGTVLHEVRDAAAFVAALRRLKDASGLTYRQLEARAAGRGRGLSHSTLAGALNRVSLPRAELVSAFVRACGCPEEELRAWLALHRRLSGGGADGVRADGVRAGVVPPVAPGPVDPSPPPPPRHPYLHVVPAQLPADSPAFTGRHTELDQILPLGPDGRPDGRRDGRPDGRRGAGPDVSPEASPDASPGLGPDQDAATTMVVVAIDGMAGVGKTALAVHAAHRLASAFPDGRLFVDLHGYTQGVEPMDPAVGLEIMLRALGIPNERIPPRLDERAALYRTRLSGTRMLVVLDNAHNESQVSPLLPAAPGSLVLITGRRRLVGLPVARHISLDVLPLADAITLFAHPLGMGRLACEPPERLAEVAELCGRLPLALRIAAARLQSRPVWTLTDLAVRLAHHRDRPTEPQDARRDVHAALDLSYRQLTSDQRRVYRLLGLHPGADIDTHAATALADTSVAHTVRLLDDLVDSHLLTEPAPGRYRFHDLTRVHATITAAAEDTEEDRHAALTRLFGHYAHTASVAMNAVYPYEAVERPDAPPTATPVPTLTTPEQAKAWLDAELANLLAAAHAAARRAPRHTLHQSATLHRYLRFRGRYDDAMLLHRRAIDTASTENTGVPGALNRLGEIHFMLGRYDEALRCFERALHLARTTADRHGELYALFGCGYVRHAVGRYEESADDFARGLDLACATGHREAELFALCGVGRSHRVLGRYEEAERCLARARDLAHAAGDRLGELWVLVGLGDLRRSQSRHVEAADHYEQALRIARATGERDGEMEAVHGLGHCHHVHGRYQNALACHRTALTYATERGYPDDQARAHDRLAHAHQALGHHDRARDHWRSALAILTEPGHVQPHDPQMTTVALRARLRGLEAAG